MSLLRPILTLVAAALMLPALMLQPAPVHAAPYENSQPGLTGTGGDNKDPITEKAVKNTSVVEYVNDAYQFIAIIGGLLAVLMLIYAGYRYMTSYGDPDKISDAKDVVEKALIGLALLILAALILNTINPRTSEQICQPQYNGKGENTNTECGDIDFTKPDGGASQLQKQNQKQNNGNN